MFKGLNMADGHTNIRVSDETHRRAKEKKREGETWDAFVERLLEVLDRPDVEETMRAVLAEELPDSTSNTPGLDTELREAVEDVQDTLGGLPDDVRVSAETGARRALEDVR